MESKSDSHENDENMSFPFLKKITSKHPKNLFFGQLNVNSVRNKFESVQEIVQNTFDIFLVCETKIDSSFSNQQLCIPEYRIFRKDRNARGGLLFSANQDLNYKALNKYRTRQNLEILVLELKLSKTNWLVNGTYKPPSLSDIAFTSEISNILTFYRSTHDNIFHMGGFNMTPNNPKLSELIADHELCTLTSEPTCFKSINPTCIDNFLTNKKTRFMKTLTFETGLSDHHKLIGTMLRSTFAKRKPKKIFYRCYRNFDKKKFEEELQKQLLSVSDCESFQFAFKVILNQFAPLKQKLIRNNNQPFMTKTLRKAIMKRSKLRNKFNEERNFEN